VNKLVLFACILVLSLVAGCSPVATGPLPVEEPVVSTTTLNGMPIRYVIKESVVIPDTDKEIDTWTEWTGEECLIVVQEEYSRTLEPRSIAEHVSSCYSQRQGDFETPQAAYAFSEAYASAYINKCGELFEPLGWFDADDGECEPPDPNEINI